MAFFMAPVAYQYVVPGHMGSTVPQLTQAMQFPGMMPQASMQYMQPLPQQRAPVLFPQPPPTLPPSLAPSVQPKSQRPPQGRPRTRAAISDCEIAAGVESLYRDELKPYGRILRKRLTELAQAAGRSFEMDVKELRSACEACTWLEVRDVEGADWAALLPGRPAAFIDVYSPQDIYAPDLWEAAADYFRKLDDSMMVLPGGRYACAQVLLQRQVPFLQRRSLGQVCHIVQLAISQKKLLGYLNGTVVPYNRSQSMVKEKHAEHQRPCPGAARGKSSVASWDMMRVCLRDIFANTVATEGHCIPLSNMKRMFRAQFQLELSETALGYAKLSELFTDSRLHDLCQVKLMGNGYVIVPVKQPTKRSLICLSDSLCLEEGFSTPLKGPQAAGGLLRKRASFVEPLCMEVILSPQASNGSGVAATTVEVAPLRTPLPSTPSPISAYGRSLPRLLGSARVRQLQDVASVAKGGAGRDGAAWAVSSPGRNKACALAAMPCSPLPTAETAPFDRTPGSGRAQQRPATSWRPAPLTPSTLGNFGFSVHNTFIHAAMPPPTPLVSGAQYRSRSLPRDTC